MYSLLLEMDINY